MYNKDQIINKIQTRYKEIGKVNRQHFYKKYKINFYVFKRFFKDIDEAIRICNIEVLETPSRKITFEKRYGVERAKTIRKKLSMLYKGKSYEEIHGEDMAKLVKDKKSLALKGKSYEDLMGKVKADKLKKHRSELRKGKSYEEVCGSLEKARQWKDNFIEARSGKTYIDTYGEERALLVYKKNSLSHSKWGKGFYEDKCLDKIEKKLGYQVDRHFFVLTNNKKVYHPDGYIHELNLCIEVDGEYHKVPNVIIKDKNRENEIKEVLQCDFLRVPENPEMI